MWVEPLLLFGLISSLPVAIAPAHLDQFIVWNVGQGLWTTYSSPSHCEHSDMGGEFLPESEIRKECGEKSNAVSISHWDWDHLGFLPQASRFLKGLCVRNVPPARVPSESKGHALGAAHLCVSNSTLFLLSPTVQTLYPSNGESLNSKRENENSRVLVLADRFLQPGDSPLKSEKTWIQRIALKESRQIRWLVLGHHGSRTSTGENLLKTLPRLRGALISARKKRYGHPHSETLQRVKAQHIPALNTEDWGTLRIEVAPFKN